MSHHRIQPEGSARRTAEASEARPPGEGPSSAPERRRHRPFAGSLHQRTVARPVRCEGIGLHSGAPVRLRLLPAAPDAGVHLVRTDLRPAISIAATAGQVVDTRLATTLGQGEVRIGTVEHLLAAIAGLGIDNLRVEVEGPEIPVQDGSAAPFVRMLREAGVREQEAPRRVLVVKRPIVARDGDKEARLVPSSRLQVTASISFDHPLLASQRLHLELDEQAFEQEICAARTFGFRRDVEQLQKAGLARGGSLDNAVVLDDERVLNPGGLRFPDEFVRHKILDAIGDLALVGMPVVAHLFTHKSGHALHHKLVQRVLSEPAASEVVELRAGLDLSRLWGGLHVAEIEPDAIPAGVLPA